MSDLLSQVESLGQEISQLTEPRIAELYQKYGKNFDFTVFVKAQETCNGLTSEAQQNVFLMQFEELLVSQIKEAEAKVSAEKRKQADEERRKQEEEREKRQKSQRPLEIVLIWGIYSPLILGILFGFTAVTKVLIDPTPHPSQPR